MKLNFNFIATLVLLLMFNPVLAKESINFGYDNYRSNSFTAGIKSSYLKADNLQEHIINIDARYGWNFVRYEVGPLISISLTDKGAGYDSDFNVGGYFDYNILANTNRTNITYGLTAQIYGGNREFTSGASSQAYAIGGGGFLTCFLFNSSAAIRFEGLAQSKKIATSSASENAMGFNANMLLIVYY